MSERRMSSTTRVTPDTGLDRERTPAKTSELDPLLDELQAERRNLSDLKQKEQRVQAEILAAALRIDAMRQRIDTKVDDLVKA
jgi:DNA repair ATPase RecN